MLTVKIRLEVLVKNMEVKLLQTILAIVFSKGKPVYISDPVEHMETFGICPNPTDFCGEAASQSKEVSTDFWDIILSICLSIDL